VSVVSHLHSTKNNPYTKSAYFGVVCCHFFYQTPTYVLGGWYCPLSPVEEEIIGRGAKLRWEMMTSFGVMLAESTSGFLTPVC
jgi:hypothetical protein